MAELNDNGENGLVEQFFIEYFNEVKEHLDYENQVVFPYIINLSGKLENAAPNHKQAHYSVKEYREHHNDIQEKLNDLKSLLIKYLPRQNDLPLRRKLLFMLSELEYDLDIHSRIEDRILIPLVAEMEMHLKTTE
jgi:regulator of cell morphogenesis and NO signaling